MADEPHEHTGRRREPGAVKRSLTTDIAIAVSPTAAVVAGHLLGNRKPKDEPAPKQDSGKDSQ